MNKKILIIALLASIFIIFNGALCNKSANNQNTNSSGGPGSQAVASTQVYINKESYNPQEINITKGSTVIWENYDTITHTVTADNNLFDSGQLTQGKTFQYTFNTAGTYTYHCSIHPTMVGKITVQ